MKPTEIKNGYVFFRASGTMSPAVLKIFPSGLLIVEWCNEHLKGIISNGPEYRLEENKFGAVSFTAEA